MMNDWTPDPSQQAIISIHSGTHLVLAPPGCGKTQILAERIFQALAAGVSPNEMLCLTFTNRAARGMRERIDSRVGETESRDVFVGNVHRFCSHFLFTNNVVAAESAVIDDETANSILARYMNEDEAKVEADFRRRKAYAQIIFFAHFMYALEKGYPKALRIHSECVTREDQAVMKAIATLLDKSYDANLMIDIYNNADFYLSQIDSPDFPRQLYHDAVQTLTKMKFAHAYTAYKRLNHLLDFEDLLQFTYTTLYEDRQNAADPHVALQYQRYPWIQVDEVQDLNMLQLAIIRELCQREEDMVTDSASSTPRVILYLGDEQQAIFSFMGAKLSTLAALKNICKGNIHHLGINHRSPKPLLDMLNAYAVANLSSDPSLLPIPESNDQFDSQCELRILRYENIWAELQGVVKRAMKAGETAGETTAIIVNSNSDADEIGEALTEKGIPHFKISGTDIFSTPEVKLLLAHANVLGNDHNFLAWSRILSGLRVCETPASARQFVHQLRKVGITPSDFLQEAPATAPFDIKSTYLQRFVQVYDNEDVVVFDTETTGLDVFNDDILQIAAERIRQGVSIEKFSVYIETDKAIPEMLGDIVNPIIEERKHQQLYTHREALKRFVDFVGDSPLLAHNAEFDRHILYYNLERYCPDILDKKNIESWDSLKLIRLLRPDLHAFKLKLLLAELGLQGENSHLADDDVNATVSLVNYCYAQAKKMLPLQESYLIKKSTEERIARLRRNYAEVYVQGMARLYDRQSSVNDQPALVAELNSFYQYLIDGRWIKPVEKMDYIFTFLAKDVINAAEEPSLRHQLDGHLMELNTFKEADLCGSSIITERIFVSTIHKAKGLEFDNVFVYDVVDGRIPNFYNENNIPLLQEDARKLYVAMSRAKKRLYVCYSSYGRSSSAYPRKLSRFMEPVMGHFQR